MGCWTPTQQLGVDVSPEDCERQAKQDGIFWNARLLESAGNRFEVQKHTAAEPAPIISSACVDWGMTGMHNISNGLAALAAAHHAGVALETGCEALSRFAGVKRRMELRGEVNGVKVYDDFAHHPTAIATTLQGMAARLMADPQQVRLIAVIEPRSNTMRMGIHQQQLAQATGLADLTVWKRPEQSGLDLDALVAAGGGKVVVIDKVSEIIKYLVDNSVPGDHIVIMSNGGFEGIHQKLLEALSVSGM